MLKGVNTSVMGTSPVSECDLSHFQKWGKMMIEISVKASDGQGGVNARHRRET